MRHLEEKLRSEAKRLLKQSEVSLVIGWGAGTEPARCAPVFITDPEQAEQLTWNPFCANSLVKYLLDYRNLESSCAVVVKGCDARAINRLIQDQQLDEEKLVVLGIPCTGMLDKNKTAAVIDPRATVQQVMDQGETYKIITDLGDYDLNKADYLMAKCLRCENHNPVVADIMLEQPLEVQPPPADRFAGVKELEALSPAAKAAYWDRQFQRCLRCYACRNVCPACSCRQCVFDQASPAWVSKRNSLSENTAFHVIRAFHVAGRCVDCGECDRVCPVDIPLRNLNQKILKDIDELFGAPTPGSNIEALPVLGEFNKDDPDEFK